MPKCPAGILRLGESRPPTRPSTSWNLHSGLWLCLYSWSSSLTRLVETCWRTCWRTGVGGEERGGAAGVESWSELRAGRVLCGLWHPGGDAPEIPETGCWRPGSQARSHSGWEGRWGGAMPTPSISAISHQDGGPALIAWWPAEVLSNGLADCCGLCRGGLHLPGSRPSAPGMPRLPGQPSPARLYTPAAPCPGAPSHLPGLRKHGSGPTWPQAGGKRVTRPEA